MIKKSGLFIILILIILPVFSQSKLTISGYVKDAGTGEELIGATVYISELKTGTITNSYGFYSFTLPEGNYTLIVSYIGYQSFTSNIKLNASAKLDVEMGLKSDQLDEVTITGEKKNANITSTEMSTIKMEMKQIENIPVLFGEKDILKTIQLMPGVSSSGEGSTGLSVRGGSTDQNLILLDEAPVYNASHLLGFFSVFNSDAIKDMTLYKGGIPAQFGGRASSVLDIQMNNGNQKQFNVQGGIGLISSRLTIEGPIVKEKGSFIISGRRTYIDLFLALAGSDFANTTLYFYDLNAKANYKLSESDRIYISGYLGRDVFGRQSIGMDWGNKTTTLRWNHLFNQRLFSNTSFIYSTYDYAFDVSRSDIEVSMGSGIVDYNLKEDLGWFVNPNNTIKIGFNVIHHQFNPGELISSGTQINSIIMDKKNMLEGGVYISNSQRITSLINAEYGLRLSAAYNMGPTTEYTYNNNNVRIDSALYGGGQFFNGNLNLEPRLSFTYTLNESSSVKASYNRMAQYMHQISNSGSGQPNDIWVPLSNNIKPLIADQLSLGYFKNLMNNDIELSVEGYYKKLQNTVDYEDGADILLNDDLESQLVFGDGYSYGLEFLLRKNAGRFTGWIGYTLARSANRFDDINNGNYFPIKYDRTHDISIVGTFKLNEKLTLSATWIYATGNAVTFPAGTYEIDGKLQPYYTERNGGRMPATHRLDVGLNWQRKKTLRFESGWNFSIYNVYGRENPYSISFRESESNPGTMETVQLSLFRFVPSISYNFKF